MLVVEGNGGKTTVHWPAWKAHNMLPIPPTNCPSFHPCSPPACREVDCPKNHNIYTKVHGKHTASSRLEHFKNDQVKFAQTLPLAPKMIEMFVLLEQAVAAMSPGSPTLFVMDDGR